MTAGIVPVYEVSFRDAPSMLWRGVFYAIPDIICKFLQSLSYGSINTYGVLLTYYSIRYRIGFTLDDNRV